MRLQSFSDVVPVCLIRYTLADSAVDVLMKVMMSRDIITMMEKCLIQVALMGSDFDQEVCGKQKQGRACNVDIRLLANQPCLPQG